jgi:hypothetical protein
MLLNNTELFYSVNNNDVCINVVHVKFEVLMNTANCLDGTPCSLIEW